MLFLKILLLTCSIELGYIPGHDLGLYEIHETSQHIINIDHTLYFDYKVNLEIAKYGFITGGITSYSMPFSSNDGFYPFRSDFMLGAGFKYKYIQIGWEHGCYHPLSPNASTFPLPMVNAAQDRFYLKAEIGR